MKQLFSVIFIPFALIFVGVIALVSAIVSKNEVRWQIWISIDQLLNTAIRGWADETISARAYRRKDENKRWKATMMVLDGLFYPWDKDHCFNSYTSEITNKQKPMYRDAV